jgi:FkbM family methyltransferase
MQLRRLIPENWKRALKIRLGAPDMFWSIGNLKKNGFHPTTILDIGAYHGEWTSEAKKVFPEARFLMVEANPEKEDILASVCKKLKGVEFEIALLACQSNLSKEFNLLENGSSVLEEFNETSGKKIRLTTATVDNLLGKRSIEKVDFIKIDVQGYELEILRGAEKYLETCEVILSEVSLMALHKDCPVMVDVVNFMDRFDYCAYDICSVATRRPYDMALWQTDIIFVKKHSKLLASKRFF